jgi:predicted ATPase/transcriptional regulator with XRE-family HTH domain
MGTDAAEMTFGLLLRRLRLAAGLTQEALAERAHLSQRGINDLERGARRLPHRDTVQLLADALALSAPERTRFEALAQPVPRQRGAGEGNEAATAPSATPWGPTGHNLPAQLTSFIGREHALAQVRWQLTGRPDRQRLLTLTGAGGCGKTRLALEVAAGLVERYAQGVWLVELAPLADPALVPLAVATALGLREETGQPLVDTLTAALRSRHVLVVLDNCEHVIAACATLAAALLRACPELQVLATSREPLGLAGEMVWRVPSLLAPDPEQPQPPDALTQYEAVRLFVERAQAVQPLFTLSDRNTPAVAQICRRLDGIPLAIELAAALVRGLSADQIARRLDDRFRLLISSDRMALPRRQTLRATVDWSYDLLSPHEQTLFNRLSVFAGSFTIEAAEAVCAGGPITAGDVPGVLLRLVDTSLVVTEDNGGEIERYRLLETLRQYGNERLLAAGEADDLAARYLAYYCGLADEAHLGLQRHPHTPWLERLEAEYPNIRQALRWALDTGTIQEGLHLAGGLQWFWYYEGYTGEGLQWLGALLARPEAAARTTWRARALACLAFLRTATRWLAGAEATDAETRALIDEAEALARETGAREVLAGALYLRGISRRDAAPLEESLALYRDELHITRWVHSACRDLGHIAWEQGDKARAQGWWAECPRLSHETGDPFNLAIDLTDLGLLAYDEGDYARARSLLEERLALCRTMDRPALSDALRALAAVARAQGDTGLARACYEETRALWQQVGDRTGTAQALADLAGITRQEGALTQAEALCREALALRRALGHRPDIAASLAQLGDLAHERADYKQAAAHYREGLALVQGSGDRGAAALCLAGIARLVAARGLPAKATRLYAAAALRSATWWPPSGWDERIAHDQQVVALHGSLGEDAFVAAWEAGQAMGLEQAVAEALADHHD